LDMNPNIDKILKKFSHFYLESQGVTLEDLLFFDIPRMWAYSHYHKLW
jgi:hypothetical protein